MSPTRGMVVAIVQARMTSTRLAGKVLTEIGGEPAILLLLRRLGLARELDGILVATSTDASDEPLVSTVEAAGHTVVRGPLGDVLERYRMAAAHSGCDAIVRITGDCPLMDPAVVDRVVARWRAGSEDYVANIIAPRTCPDGFDVEVLSRLALEISAAEARDPVEREHVTSFVRARSDRFEQARVDCRGAYGWVRITLDTPEDLALIRQVVARVGPLAGATQILAALGIEMDHTEAPGLA